MTKAELRRKYKAKRAALSKQEYTRRNENIFAHFRRYFPITQPTTVHCYLSSEEKREASTDLIIIYLLEQPQVQVVVSRSQSDGTLTHYRFTHRTNLEINQWGIREPSASETLVTVQELDQILVPLLISDESGFRVGYGKGYYDRFLPQCRSDAVKIGLSLEPPISRITDIDQYDIPLDYLITPAEVFSY